MDIFLLGAGRPATGKKPSALKPVLHNTTALDWQIHSFTQGTTPSKIHFLGGYSITDIIDSYPQLNIINIPNWHKNTVLHSFSEIPFQHQPFIVSYADTIFRHEVITQLCTIQADIVVAFDSLWRSRYQQRTTSDIAIAELISPSLLTTPTLDSAVEFTGLIYFSATSATILSQLNLQGSSLLDLLQQLKQQGLSITGIDVKGQWAEFNAPSDLARFICGTKAETLARLTPIVKHSIIDPSIYFDYAQWQQQSANLLQQIQTQFIDKNIVIRSSTQAEDSWQESHAGSYTSLLNINPKDTIFLNKAIEQVIASYHVPNNQADQVLVQECITDVLLAGVIFTCDLENGAPYYRINFDDQSASTESVTSGQGIDLRTFFIVKETPLPLNNLPKEIQILLHAVQELEYLLGYDKLDIEFAIDKEQQVHVFQVRPITVDHSRYEFDVLSFFSRLKQSRQFFQQQQLAPPGLFGHFTVYGHMPDWNPAEIIGTKPKPLALSLYQQLITNKIWAQQRAEFGYQQLTEYPLIYCFNGQPYVDIRASLNSFLPKNLSAIIKDKVIHFYLNYLIQYPMLHDKLEFAVTFTCWLPDIKQLMAERFYASTITPEEQQLYIDALKIITQQAFTRLTKDLTPLTTLFEQRQQIKQSGLPPLTQAYQLLLSCQKHGTLPFAHAARAGFIATQLLQRLVELAVLSQQRVSELIQSIHTVTREFEQDKQDYQQQQLTLADMLERYGHLRPGTYDLTTLAYWENPQHYFSIKKSYTVPTIPTFTFTPQEQRQIEQHLQPLGDISAIQLLTYCQQAIRGREYAKFEFTKNLSLALDQIICWGNSLGLQREQLAFIHFDDLQQYYLNQLSDSALKQLIQSRQQHYQLCQWTVLPSIISHVDDFYAFEQSTSLPNFVTKQRIQGQLCLYDPKKTQEFSHKIILIPQADPGYDWLFTQNIAGLITQYGGINSHMAIRAAELDLPAAIGIGEKLYEQLKHDAWLELDCNSQQIRSLQ